MTRRLLNLLTALSLLLCVAVVALWVRSYFVTEVAGWGRVGHGAGAGRLRVYGVGSGRGRVVLVVVDSAPSELNPEYARGFYLREPPAEVERDRPHLSVWNRMGFFLLERPENGVILPMWLLAVAAMALPVCRATAWRRARKRRLTGHCPGCGYDLRATPGRCPECGTAPPPS